MVDTVIEGEYNNSQHVNFKQSKTRWIWNHTVDANEWRTAVSECKRLYRYPADESVEWMTNSHPDTDTGSVPFHYALALPYIQWYCHDFIDHMKQQIAESSFVKNATALTPERLANQFYLAVLSPHGEKHQDNNLFVDKDWVSNRLKLLFADSIPNKCWPAQIGSPQRNKIDPSQAPTKYKRREDDISHHDFLESWRARDAKPQEDIDALKAILTKQGHLFSLDKDSLEEVDRIGIIWTGPDEYTPDALEPYRLVMRDMEMFFTQNQPSVGQDESWWADTTNFSLMKRWKDCLTYDCIELLRMPAMEGYIFLRTKLCDRINRLRFNLKNLPQLTEEGQHTLLPLRELVLKQA